MTWSPQKSCGQEATKIRPRLKEYLIGNGLDLGCGPDKIHPEALGVDVAPFPGVNYVLDVRDLYPFKKQTFDYVFSSHTLEDLEDPLDALKEWSRVLKSGGLLILYLPHKDLYPNLGQEGSNPAHKNDFVEQTIIDFLGLIGKFRILVTERRDEENEYSFLIVARKLI